MSVSIRRSHRLIFSEHTAKGAIRRTYRFIIGNAAKVAGEPSIWIDDVCQSVVGTGRTNDIRTGLLLPVGDRQLSKVQRPVPRFAPELAASECRAVVISAQRSAAFDPEQTSAIVYRLDAALSDC
jgi:hypothetical protein